MGEGGGGNHNSLIFQNFELFLVHDPLVCGILNSFSFQIFFTQKYIIIQKILTCLPLDLGNNGGNVDVNRSRRNILELQNGVFHIVMLEMSSAF